MEANELRQNNWVLLTKDGFKTSKPYQLTAFDIYKADESDCADIKPIELTEEWHNKFGVFKNGFGNFEYRFENKLNLFLTFVFTGDYVMIRQGKEKRIDDDIVSIFNKDLTKRNMYVHEFQNIVHALTQTELEINL